LLSEDAPFVVTRAPASGRTVVEGDHVGTSWAKVRELELIEPLELTDDATGGRGARSRSERATWLATPAPSVTEGAV
jgi:hypothetical protein